ncbi:RNA-binding protein [bacterium]|nr:RNA-binding protein [bacterium]
MSNWLNFKRYFFRRLVLAEKKIYVGNIPYSLDNDSLKELFDEFGAVESAQIISDRDTGRSKGFAFVEMSNSEEAQAAIEAMNGKEVDGRTLTVNEAKPRVERSDRGGRRR